MNKNTRQLKKMIRQSVRAKESEFVIKVPVHNYHNYPNDEREKALKKRTITVPIMGKDGVVSRSKRRNMQMKVYQNNGVGGTASMTSHEPIDPTEPVVFKNHSYMTKENQYKQPSRIKAAA